MKLRLAWFVALFAVTVVSGVQAADDWKTYRYPQYGFSAKFPTEPPPQDQKFDPKR